MMTWLSYSTKTLSLFIVLPLILKKFTPPEISLWYLFSSIIVLMGLADMGFRSTFSRIISFAMGGAEDIGIYQGNVSGDAYKSPNWKLIEKISSNMKIIYFFLSVLLFILFVTFGSWSLIRPISQVEDQHGAWLAWTFIIITSVIKFYGTIYSNYLEGLNKVALVRRIESLTSLGSIVSSITVLILGGNLFHLVISIQTWVVVNTVRDWYLARYIEEGKYIGFKSQHFDKILFPKIWSPAWRSGLSGLMSNGLTLLSGIVYAQIGSPELVAAYLLALRIMTQIKEISMAPFYSKIPLMARLRVEGKSEVLISNAQKGMFVGHIAFVMGVIIVSLTSNRLLSLINSNVPFVTSQFWLLLSFAFFVQRFGAMHIQLYLTTNHVISHIADGISGILFITFSFLFVNQLGIYSIPFGMLVGYLGFYAWYASIHSYRSLNVNFWNFEKRASITPFFLMVVYVIIIIFK
jgi:hypothetical protein